MDPIANTPIRCYRHPHRGLTTLRIILCLLLLLIAPSAFAFQRDVITRALEVTGFSKTGDRVLHWHDAQGIEQNYQSAPPFVSIPYSREAWFDPESGVERSNAVSVYPGSGPGKPAVSLLTPGGVFFMRDTVAVPIAGPVGERNLNLWAVLSDWRNADDVRALGDQVYAGYPRTVLARTGEFGEERLFLDPKSGFPVKLEREEPHYLWGQVRVEFTYQIWRQSGNALLPTAVSRVVDGFKEIARTIGDFEFIDRASAPDLKIPAASPAGRTPIFLQPVATKKVEISAKTFLSVNTGYTEAITLIGDTIYILDSTQGEERAKQDFELIHTTFPGPHPIILVVTDLAWPHIAGIRFWVAQGATVISHRTSRDFLTRIVGRRWTLNPDLLEKRRNTVKFKFSPIDKEQALSGGKLRLSAIDGIGTEGSLMAYLPDDQLLWASDFIQNVIRPATYTTEVWQAVQRAGFVPRRVAAMHIPLTDWSKIEAIVKALN